MQERHASLGGRLFPGSIRDQQIRGEMLAYRSYQKGWWRPGGKVLVIGAGVAGVSAALAVLRQDFVVKSLRQKTTVYLIEQKRFPFFRQRASVRPLEPFAYDWPHPDWARPQEHGVLPLRGAQTNVLLDEWLTVFREAIATYKGMFHVLTGTTYDPGAMIPVAGAAAPTGYQVRLEVAGKEVIYDVDTVLDCSGHGKEIVRFGGADGIPPEHNNFVGMEYWKQDRIAEVGFGIPGWPGTDRKPILLVGGGDGALQDTLRNLTGKTAIEILREWRGDTQTAEELAGLEAEMGECEERLSRALHYEHNKGQRAALLARHYEEVRQIVSTRMPKLKRLAESTQELLRDEWKGWPNGLAGVILMARESYLGRCYAANLVLIVLFEFCLRGLLRIELQQAALAAGFMDVGDPDAPLDEHWGKAVRVWVQTVGEQEVREQEAALLISRCGVELPAGQQEVVQVMPPGCPWWSNGAN